MSPTVLNNEEIREILVKRVDQQKQAVGIVVGVIDPDGRRVVAYGNLASADPRTLDGDTIFEIGSITKVFTSLLLADMVNRNEVALDDPASKYLPESVKMPERSGKSITLHDLSTHTSGLPRLPGNIKFKDPRNPYADYSVADLYQFLSGYELPRDPGSEFEYSNLGGGLLGHLLASRAGTDYESLIGTRITRPLGMPDTGITLSISMKQRMATGHTAMLAPTANWDLPTLAGAGALRGSANDMLTFLEAFLGYKETPLAPAMQAMLEVRRCAGQTAAQPSAQTQGPTPAQTQGPTPAQTQGQTTAQTAGQTPAQTPTPTAGQTASQTAIGLGWLLNSADGREIAHHDGGTGGFRSWVGYDPKQRIGAVVLSNGTRSGVEDIGLHLLNPHRPLANPEPPKQHTEIHIDPKLLDNYTGRYKVNPNLILEVTRDGDRLFTQGFAEVKGEALVLPKFEVFAEGEKNFFARVADNQITFETGPEGRATSLIIHRAGRDMPAAPRLS